MSKINEYPQAVTINNNDLFEFLGIGKFLLASDEFGLVSNNDILSTLRVPFVNDVGNNFVYGICPYIREKYKIPVLAVSHEDIGFTQGSSYVIAEFVDAVEKCGIPCTACRL